MIFFMAAILRSIGFNSAVEKSAEGLSNCSMIWSEYHFWNSPHRKALAGLFTDKSIGCRRSAVFNGNKQEWILCFSRSAFIFSVTWPLKLSIIITAALSSPSNFLVVYTNGIIMLSTYWIIVSSVDQCLGEWVMFQSSRKLKCGFHRSVLPL